MPSAVWQGFRNLLRDPSTAELPVHRPSSRGSLGGHGASPALSKVSRRANMASKTAPAGHQGREDG